jgi:mitochondrial fission protein ELM1
MYKGNTNLPSVLKVWIFHDDRAGHISQLQGLLYALSNKTTIEPTWFEAQSIHFELTALLKPKPSPESPGIIIGAGHSTHKDILLCARAHKAVSFVVMKPSLPQRLFDGIICPQHDGLKNNERVFNTQGPISKIPPRIEGTEQEERSRHLFLIGGPSKHYAWNSSALTEQIQEICNARSDIEWSLSDSPRTPKDFVKNLNALKMKNLSCYHYQDDNFGSISPALKSSAFTWVTPDSMSMIYESMTAGSPTGLLKLPATKKAEKKHFCRHIEDLLEAGPVMGFDQWRRSKTQHFYPPVPPPPNDANRAADWLLERYQQLRAN